jgi:mRNA-degrading endonuclease YafQ of YafQ-DinJ toxin-antitoxin module
LRENLAKFSEATIKVSNPDQEMFVSTFHNGYFNESLGKKPATSMQEIIKRVECYIKGEEINVEKRSRDAREKDPIKKGNKAPDFYPQHRRQPDHRGQESQRKPYHQQVRRDVERFPQREYTSLNRVRVYILDEILETRMTQLPPHRGKDHTLEGNLNAWRAYHICKGHDTEKCFRLRDLIEELIKSGHLRKFLDGAANGKVVVPKTQRNPQGDQGGEKSGEEKVIIAVNTIARGFADGGESSAARKRYVRQLDFEAKFVGHTFIAPIRLHFGKCISLSSSNNSHSRCLE